MRRSATRLLSALALVCGLAATIAPPAGADDPSRRITLPGPTTAPAGLASRPEGIAHDGHQLYVSSVASGAIFTASADDDVATVFLPAGSPGGPTSATGMKVNHGRLFVSGAATGKVFVYDIATKALLFSATVAAGGPTFINDVAVADDGTAYFTDSQRPVLYRLAPSAAAGGPAYTFETFVNFTGTPFVYQSGFNANGIVVTEDNHYALVVQANTGKLFRIGLTDRSVVEVDLGGATLNGGDGLVLRGQTLYTIAGSTGVTKVRLRDHFTSGAVREVLTDDTFAGPTTAALVGSRLYIVNAQFAAGANATLPFWVSDVKAP